MFCIKKGKHIFKSSQVKEVNTYHASNSQEIITRHSQECPVSNLKINFRQIMTGCVNYPMMVI